jgi:zinc protease
MVSMQKVKRLIILGLILLFPAAAQAIDSQVTMLDNGLKLITLEDHKSPVVTFQIWYRVGSIDETAGTTGLSHLMEHMMFKGTKKYPKGEFSRRVAQNGGTENAFTSKEYTAFFEKFASDRLELSLKLESDRMQNLQLDPKEVTLELDVVKEERRSSTDDDPTSLLIEDLYAAAFKVHPYHSPVIGWMTELDSLRYEDLVGHYKKYYVPNNAIIVVVGDFETASLISQIKRYFGDIPPGELYPRRKLVEPEQLGERRIELHKSAQLPFVAIAYHVPNLTHPDSFALEVVQNILSAGKSSRLYQELVYKKRIALYAGGDYNRINSAPELFLFYGGLQPDKTSAEFEQAVYQQLEKLKTEPISDSELQKAKNQVEASFVFGQDSIFYQAMQIGQLETIGVDHKPYLDQFVANVRAVTKQDVMRVAQDYFGEINRTVAVLFPEKSEGVTNAE